MKKDLEKISTFLSEHHVLSFGTCNVDEVSVCSLFYVYDSHTKSFIVASSEDTLHIEHSLINNKIAGNILLETKNIGKIQGVQFRGRITKLDSMDLEEMYFKAFTAARIMQPILWRIQVEYFKMTDNTLGFGKKIIWLDSSLQT